MARVALELAVDILPPHIATRKADLSSFIPYEVIPATGLTHRRQDKDVRNGRRELAHGTTGVTLGVGMEVHPVRVSLTADRCQGYLDKVPKRVRERSSSEYMRFLQRAVKGAGKRFADDDPEQLMELLLVEQALEVAIIAAIRGMRRSGATWDDIGSAVGITRQAAHERWSRKVDSE